MRTYNKVLTLLLIAVLAVSVLASGVFAAGGQAGDPKPSLEITKFRPKEATEYSWEMREVPGNGWVETELGSDVWEFFMDMEAERTMDKDELQLYFEANLSTFATDSLVIELGYQLSIEDDPETTEVDEASDEFVMRQRFEGISYSRLDPAKEPIKFTFVWEDIDRSMFEGPEAINKVRVIVEYVKARGSIGEVSESKEFGLEEHEAYGFAYIESDLLDVIEVAKSEDPDITCTTAVDDWYADMFSLPLGEGDIYRMQATITTDTPTALEADDVLFVARPYMENDGQFNVWYDVDPMCVYTMNFPTTVGYEHPSDNAFLVELRLEDPPGYVIATEAVVEDQFVYPMILETGTVLPTVSAVTSDGNATYAVVEATMETRAAIVTVTAEDGVTQQEYRVDFTFDGSADATLEGLTVNGQSVIGTILVPVVGATDGSTTTALVEFDSTVLHYHVVENATEGSVEIGWDLTDDNATVTRATVTYGTVDDPTTYFPRREEVIVTAEDQTTVITYSILFAPLGWTPEDVEPEGGNSGGNAKRGSKLKVLAVDNKVVEGFSPDELDYDIVLEEGTRTLPLVTAVAEDAEATVQHIKPTRLPGQYKLKVSANVVDPEDETAVMVEESVYTLNLDVEGLADGEFIELGAAPLPGNMMGLWLPPTSDDFILTRTSTQIRFWTSNSLLAPKLLIFKDEGEEKLLAGESTLMVTVSTSDLKSNSGNGKHSRTTVDNGDGGYYKYNLKGRNLPNLNEGEAYVLVLYDGDQMAEFQPGQPAILHFIMGEQVKGSVDHRNRDLNIDGRSSNTGTNQ